MRTANERRATAKMPAHALRGQGEGDARVLAAGARQTQRGRQASDAGHQTRLALCSSFAFSFLFTCWLLAVPISTEES